MRNDYKCVYRQPQQIPPTSRGSYSDPVWTEAERRADAARIAKNRAAIRRARLAERTLIGLATGTLLLTVLPVAVLVMALVVTVQVSRHLMKAWRKRGIGRATLASGLGRLCRRILGVSDATRRRAVVRRSRGTVAVDDIPAPEWEQHAGLRVAPVRVEARSRIWREA